MEFEQYKVIIEYRPELMSTVVYVFMKAGDNHTQYITKGGETTVTVERHKESKDQELWFARIQDDSVLSVLAEALDKKGIQPPKRPFVEGKLEATEAHLADMRKLVFKEKA